MPPAFVVTLFDLGLQRWVGRLRRGSLHPARTLRGSPWSRRPGAGSQRRDMNIKGARRRLEERKSNQNIHTHTPNLTLAICTQMLNYLRQHVYTSKNGITIAKHTEAGERKRSFFTHEFRDSETVRIMFGQVTVMRDAKYLLKYNRQGRLQAYSQVTISKHRR